MAATRAEVEVAHPSAPERIRVTVSVTPGHPGWFDPWDGGCPPDAGEVEVVSAVSSETGATVQLTDQDVDALLESADFCRLAEERAAELLGDEMPDYPEGE